MGKGNQEQILICYMQISRFEIYAAYFSNFEKANNIIMESIKSQDELGSFISVSIGGFCDGAAEVTLI